MTGSSALLQNTLQTGAAAATATTLATAICGELEEGNAIAPLNAISHIAWGDEAATHDEASWKYTATGMALNGAAVTSWAGIFEMYFGRAVDRQDVRQALVGGAAVSALAFVTDYYLVPRRVTPGFEKRLSNTSLFGIYSALALSLALGRMGQAQLAHAGSAGTP
ncbi:hypothetical protein [Schlesneria paludicola]|uniref:hypothetical protein n=1 Tax=Schlesneria paludicola TaxID=360056 RepID=UPI00029B1A32|nr:hypothetical protein [Schlesneria paludicola]